MWRRRKESAFAARLQITNADVGNWKKDVRNWDCAHKIVQAGGNSR